MTKKDKTAELIPLSDLISALRIVRKLKEDFERCEDRMMMHYRMEDRTFSMRCIEEAIEAHGYKKFEGKFYKLSDFQLLSPLEI